MEQIIIGGVLAFLITYLILPVIITIARAKKLYDEPDDKRKLHKRPIPVLGGLGMFIGILFSTILLIDFSTSAPEFQYYLAALFLIFFLGMKDDIMIISPAKKFMGQVLAAGILLYKANLVLTNMHGLAGFTQLNSVCCYGLSAFSIIVIINAFNLIDGVDGLAGSLGLVSSLVFGIFFMLNRNVPYAIFAFAVSGSIVAFLQYNLSPARIFMGDTGSMIIGVTNSILVIRFIETAENYADFPVHASPAVGFGILLLPLMDTLRVFAIRIANGRSPFSADRNHIHHLLLNRGFSHKVVTLICVAASIAFCVITFLLQNIGISLLIVVQMALFFSFIYLIQFAYIKKSRYKLHAIKGDAKPAARQDEVKLLPLFNNAGAAEEE